MVPVRLLLSLLFLSCLLTAGCSEPNPVQAGDGTCIMPLAIGNTWVGRSTTYDSDGNTIKIVYDTLRIVDKVTVGGEEWWITDQDIAYTNRRDGCWMSVGSPGLNPWLAAKYPAATRDTFNVEVVERVNQYGSLIDSLVMNSVVSSTSLRCLVPGGDFLCYQYQIALKDQNGLPLSTSEFPNRDDYNGYAPGIGPVVEEHYTAEQGSTYLWKRWELVSVRLH